RHEREARDESLPDETRDAVTDARLRHVAFENPYGAAGFEHAKVFAERCTKVGDVAQRDSHRHEIERARAKRKLLGNAAAERSVKMPARFGEHSGAGVAADDEAFGTDKLNGTARNRGCPDRNIEHLHAALETVELERQPPVEK